MTNLEYKIGGLNIDPNRIYFEENNPYLSAHKFIVLVNSGIASIYVSKANEHREIVYHFNLDKTKIYGGGDIYLDYSNNLALTAFSAKFNAIPKEVAQKFAELLIPELKKKKLIINGLNAHPNELLIHEYWRNND